MPSHITSLPESLATNGALVWPVTYMTLQMVKQSLGGIEILQASSTFIQVIISLLYNTHFRMTQNDMLKALFIPGKVFPTEEAVTPTTTFLIMLNEGLLIWECCTTNSTGPGNFIAGVTMVEHMSLP